MPFSFNKRSVHKVAFFTVPALIYSLSTQHTDSSLNTVIQTSYSISCQRVSRLWSWDFISVRAFWSLSRFGKAALPDGLWPELGIMSVNMWGTHLGVTERAGGQTHLHPADGSLSCARARPNTISQNHSQLCARPACWRPQAGFDNYTHGHIFISHGEKELSIYRLPQRGECGPLRPTAGPLHVTHINKIKAHKWPRAVWANISFWGDVIGVWANEWLPWKYEGDSRLPGRHCVPRITPDL